MIPHDRVVQWRSSFVIGGVDMNVSVFQQDV